DAGGLVADGGSATTSSTTTTTTSGAGGAGGAVGQGGAGGGEPVECGFCAVLTDRGCEPLPADTHPLLDADTAIELCPGTMCDGTSEWCPESCRSGGCWPGWSCTAAGECTSGDG